MAVEGKTILQTPERTELTGKEGIPFQEGERNGHVLLERINEYVSGNVVYILPGALETTKDWSTTDVESIVGNWDEFVEAVNHKVVIAKVSIGYDGIIAYIPAGIVKLDGFIGFYINAGNGIFVYSISSDRISLETLVVVPNVINNLNSDNEESALSAAQGKVLNDKIAEISNPASADKDGLMSKEDKKTFDSIRFSEDENSIWFNGKKYGAYKLNYKLYELSGESLNQSDIINALDGFTQEHWDLVSEGGIGYMVSPSEGIASTTLCSLRAWVDSSYKYLSIVIYGVEGIMCLLFDYNNSSSTYEGTVVLDRSYIGRDEIVNNLTSTNTDNPLSAAMGKELNDKIEAIKSEISALRDEIEALKGSGA